MRYNICTVEALSILLVAVSAVRVAPLAVLEVLAVSVLATDDALVVLASVRCHLVPRVGFTELRVSCPGIIPTSHLFKAARACRRHAAQRNGLRPPVHVQPLVAADADSLTSVVADVRSVEAVHPVVDIQLAPLYIVQRVDRPPRTYRAHQRHRLAAVSRRAASHTNITNHETASHVTPVQSYRAVIFPALRERVPVNTYFPIVVFLVVEQRRLG